MPFSPGDKLGPYEILAPLGAGGMGEVYRARDTRLKRDVAIKVLPPMLLRDLDRTGRFQREAEILASLDHPNIGHLHGIVDSEDSRGLVLALIEGPTLADRIEAGPIPLDEAVAIAKQIVAALEYAHDRGVVHRDLKPANVKITPDGVAKVLDFGLAKVLEDEPPPSSLANSPTLTVGHTRAGVILGTAAYMSPEQAVGRPVDRRSDIFSFGAVLYEMLAGKRAFGGATTPDLLEAVLKNDPDWSALPAGTPRYLRRLLERMLAKDRKQRLQAIGEARIALEDSDRNEPPIAPVPAASGSRLRWLWPGVAAAMTLAALALGFLAHTRQSYADDRVLSLQLDPPPGTHYVFGSNTGRMSLSPDGKNVAFIATGNGKSGLWVRSLDSTEARLIPGTESAGYPFWSPDSKAVAFFSLTGIKRVDLAGGSPQTICDAPGYRDGDWSNDGQILFSRSRAGLFRVSAAGGSPAVLTTLDASREERRHSSPQSLPGGRILYHIATNSRETGVYIGSLAKPSERIRLLESQTNALYAPVTENKGYLLWLRGQTLIAQELDVASARLVGEPHPLADPVFSSLASNYLNVAVSTTGLLTYSSFGNLSQPTWFDRTGRSLSELGEPGDYWMFRLSPDGRRLAAVTENALWFLDIDRGIRSRFTDNVRPMFPEWSPDGRTIAYLVSGAPEIWRKDSSGATPGERIVQRADWTLTDWSRDGRFLLFTIIDSKTLRDLWTLPLTPDGHVQPDAQPKLWLRTQFNESNGRFSPEPAPHWIAYQSDESGRYEIYIQSFPEPHGAIRISTSGGQYPEWSPNGRELFFIAPDNKLMAVSIKLGPNSVEPGPPHPLFTLPIDDLVFNPYEVAPDGLRFLVRATSQQAAPLTVIVNWPALLRKSPSAR